MLAAAVPARAFAGGCGGRAADGGREQLLCHRQELLDVGHVLCPAPRGGEFLPVRDGKPPFRPRGGRAAVRVLSLEHRGVGQFLGDQQVAYQYHAVAVSAQERVCQLGPRQATLPSQCASLWWNSPHKSQTAQVGHLARAKGPEKGGFSA
jgi:hypothetical protein